MKNDGSNAKNASNDKHAFHDSHSSLIIDQQLRRLENDFLEDGGVRERMTRARLQHRNKPSQK